MSDHNKTHLTFLALILLMVSITSCIAGYMIGRSQTPPSGQMLDTIVIDGARGSSGGQKTGTAVHFSGTVVSKGMPFHGTVELHSQPRVTDTDASGRFFFADVETGTHTLYTRQGDRALGQIQVSIEPEQSGQRLAVTNEGNACTICMDTEMAAFLEVTLVMDEETGTILADKDSVYAVFHDGMVVTADRVMDSSQGIIVLPSGTVVSGDGYIIISGAAVRPDGTVQTVPTAGYTFDNGIEVKSDGSVLLPGGYTVNPGGSLLTSQDSIDLNGKAYQLSEESLNGTEPAGQEAQLEHDGLRGEGDQPEYGRPRSEGVQPEHGWPQSEGAGVNTGLSDTANQENYGPGGEHSEGGKTGDGGLEDGPPANGKPDGEGPGNAGPGGNGSGDSGGSSGGGSGGGDSGGSSGGSSGGGGTGGSGGGSSGGGDSGGSSGGNSGDSGAEVDKGILEASGQRAGESEFTSWSSTSAIDLFYNRQDNEKDGSSILPGARGFYRFQLSNTRKEALSCTIALKEAGFHLPMEFRLVSEGEPETGTWIRVEEGKDVILLTGKVEAENKHIYRLEWSWPLNSGNDDIDTKAGVQPDGQRNYIVNVNITADNAL